MLKTSLIFVLFTSATNLLSVVIAGEKGTAAVTEAKCSPGFRAVPGEPKDPSKCGVAATEKVYQSYSCVPDGRTLDVESTCIHWPRKEMPEIIVFPWDPKEREKFDNLPSCDKLPNREYCDASTVIYRTNYSAYETFLFTDRPLDKDHFKPQWRPVNDGYDIEQLVNSYPTARVSPLAYYSVDFDGYVTVKPGNGDDDFIGFVFSFESPKRFYVISWKQKEQEFVENNMKYNANAGVTIKAVDSPTGCSPKLERALWSTVPADIPPNELKIIYEDPKHQGWEDGVKYRVSIVHRPYVGLIRLRIFDDEKSSTKPLIDSGNIFDKSYRGGGRLGPYMFSQPNVLFEGLNYKCGDSVPRYIYDELPNDIKPLVNPRKV